MGEQENIMGEQENIMGEWENIMGEWEGHFYLKVPVVVNADDYSSALGAIAERMKDAAVALEACTEYEPLHQGVFVRRQVKGPWLTRIGWYMDRPGKPSNVIVADRAFGYRFTKEGVELLRQRINSIPGLNVSCSWNGEGSTTVSYRTKGRIGFAVLTDDQRAMLLADPE